MKTFEVKVILAFLLTLYSTVQAEDFAKLFKEAVGWISDISTIVTFSEQLGSLYTCEGLCSLASERTNADVIIEIGAKLDHLGAMLSTMQFEDKVNDCYNLATSRNQQLSGALSELDSETLAETIADFDNSGGRPCLNAIHNGIMGNGVVSTSPALTIYYNQAKVDYENALETARQELEQAGDTTTLPEDVVSKELKPFNVVQRFWSSLLELEHVTYAQTVWGVTTYHSSNGANGTSSLTSLQENFNAKLLEQANFAKRFFGCRTLHIGWLQIECREGANFLQQNQTSRVHMSKVFTISSHGVGATSSLFWIPQLERFLNPPDSSTNLVSDISLATELVLVDTTQPEPSDWESKLPDFCIMERSSGMFLSLQGEDGDEPVLTNNCTPGGRFSIEVAHEESDETPVTSHYCAQDLTLGKACCPISCGRCFGFKKGASTCDENTNGSKCCAYDIYKDTTVTNQCSASNPPPCLNNPTYDYQPVCLKSSKHGNYVGYEVNTLNTGSMESNGNMEWKKDNNAGCSMSFGTEWHLEPSLWSLSMTEQEGVDNEQNNATDGNGDEDIVLSVANDQTNLMLVGLISMCFAYLNVS